MSSLERRHSNSGSSSRRGNMQSHHRKYSDGFSDTSSTGMDDTDREVSNLTDRAFRSLCIGEEAIYNDSEISSPTERHKAFAKEAQRKDVLTSTCQENVAIAYGIRHEGMERRSEVTSTFQHSSVDVAQQQVLQDERLSYTSNGSVEATWQQRRSTSRVSSLIKAFSSREGYYDDGNPDAVFKNRDSNIESWDRSALMSIHKELSEFSSSYHQNFKSGPLQSYRNHFHTSSAALSRMDTANSVVKSSKSRFKSLNSTNLFFHSEFSPFQLWKDYNRFPFGVEDVPGFVSACDFSRWYDSPLYKELTATPRIYEARRFNRRKIEDVVTTQRSKSTVIQKAPTVEKRCESETASHCTPWRRNNNFVQNKLPSTRPSTVSPTSEKTQRPDSSLLSHSRYAYDVQHKVDGHETSALFNITQLLTPVIQRRQDTETSEIQQYSHTPCSLQGEADLKSLPDVQQMRDSYKSRAPSLLFNLKDNRKRVKSTYTPTTFKGLEVTDRNKQPSKLDDIEGRLSETSVSQMAASEYSTMSHTLDPYNKAQQTHQVSSSQNIEHIQHADGSHDNAILASQYRTANYKMSYGSWPGNSLPPDRLSNRQHEECEVTAHMLLARDGSIRNSEGHIYDPSRTLTGHTRPKIEKAVQPAHSLSAQVSEKTTFSRREHAVDVDLKERTNFERNPHFGFAKNLATEEGPGSGNPPWNKEAFKSVVKDGPPFKGEIAALIEMDKQRKANAKQYLPANSDSNNARKDTYLNKINDKIKKGRLEKEEAIRDMEVSSQKYSHAGFQNRQDNPTTTHLTSQKIYGYQNNDPPKMPSSPPKQANLVGNSGELRNTMNDHLQRDAKYPGSSTSTKRAQQSPLPVERAQKNEGSLSYQPYKYDPNKQWCITASENRQWKDEIVPASLQQIKVKPEEPNNKKYSCPVSTTSYQQSAANARTAQRNLVTEDVTQVTQHKQNDSLTPKHTNQIHNATADFTRPHHRGAEQTLYSTQTREDRFSINDILSIRDNEQAKRMRDSKPSPSVSANESIKLDNPPHPGTSNIAEVKAVKTDASTVRDQQIQVQDQNFHKPANIDFGYIKKESTERSTNAAPGLKDKSGRDAFTSKDSDKITTRALSYKERGQTKQEILTSKLKAHAQKEISAIKEKELAKQGIMSRNPMKQSTATSNDKGQTSLQLSPIKKEITAEKLNHLFQDITYSSVTLHKEHDKDGPRYDSVLVEEIKLPTKIRGSRAEVASKHNDSVKDNDKENAKIPSLSDNIQAQDERLAKIENRISEVQKASKNYFQHKHLQSDENQSNSSSAEKLKSDSFTESVKDPNISVSYQTLCKEASVIDTKHHTSPKRPTEEHHTDNLLPAVKVNEGNFSRKTPTSFQETHKMTVNHSSNKETEPDDIKEEETTVKTDQKYTELKELVKERARAREENDLHETRSNAEIVMTVTPSDENKLKTKARVKSPSDLITSDTKALLPSHHSANTKEEVDIKNKSDGVSANQTESCASVAYDTPKPEAKEKQEPKVQSGSTSQINSGELHHVDKDKSPESVLASKGLGNQTSKPQEESENLQSKREIKDPRCDGIPVKRADIKTESNMESLQDVVCESQTQRGKDLQEQAEVAVTKNIASENESVESNGESPSISEKKNSHTTNAKDQQLSEPPDTVHPAPDIHTIHISSKEDETPTDEPVIYSIHVSSKSEVISEEEPVIYTICVSSICDTLKVDDPKKDESKDKTNLDQKPDAVQREESFSCEPEKTDKRTCSESKESDTKETKLEKAAAVRTDITPPADKSNSADSINSSYESLLAKYGFLVRDSVNLQAAHNRMQVKEKEKGENLSLKEQKRTTDERLEEKENVEISKRHYEEVSKCKTPEELSKPLTADEETRERRIPRSTKEHHAKSGKYTHKAATLDISDEHTSENSSQKSQPAKQDKTKIKAASSCEDKQEIPSTGALSSQTKESMQVREKMQTRYTEKQKGLIILESTNVGDKNIVMKAMEGTTDNPENNLQEMKYSQTTSISSSTSITNNKSTYSKSSITEDRKSSEASGKDGSYSRIHKYDAEIQKYKHANTNLEHPAKEAFKINDPKIKTQEESEVVKRETLTKEASIKDNKKLQSNRKGGFVAEEEQEKIRRSKESNDKTELVSQEGMSSFAKKQISSVSGNLIRNTSAAVSSDQSLHKVLKSPSEDKEANKKQFDSNTDSVKTANNKLSQHEQVAMDARTAKGATGVVLPANKNTNLSVENVPNVKPSPAVEMIEAGLKQPGNQKQKGETEARGTELLKEELKGVSRDKAPKASSPVKVEKDTECASNEHDGSVKEASAQTQDKKQETVTVKVRKDTEESKSVTVEVKNKVEESSKDTSPVKHDEHVNVYQYHPGKGFLLETRGNILEEQNSDRSTGQETVDKKKDCTLNKPAITHQERKMNKPEISALADYARLRVISAEDDSTSEKDLLKNLDMYRKFSLSAVATEPSEGTLANKKHLNQMVKPLQAKEKENLAFQRSENTDLKHEGSRGEAVVHPKLSLPDKCSGYNVSAGEETWRAVEKMNTKTSFTEQHHRHTRSHELEKSHVGPALQSKSFNDGSTSLRQPLQSQTLEKNVCSHAQHQEPVPQSSPRSELNKSNMHTESPIKTSLQEARDEEKMEELQYFTVNSMESEPKLNISNVTDPLSSQFTLKKEVPEATASGSRSNTSSPALGKPVMFRVKNNTIRNSPVTKSVKPMFRRSFSEEFLTPKEILSGSVKADIENDRQRDAKESAKPLVIHEPTAASYRLPRAKEIQSSLPLTELTSLKEPRSSFRRSQQVKDDETRSVVSSVSEDVESLAASSVVMTDGVTSHLFKTETYSTYSRPQSACYERPSSSCYDRPESACSDIRPFGKPPSIPPKTEKALRRAKRLTTRRNQKLESKLTPDSQGQLEPKSVQGVSSLPASPMESLSSPRHAFLASPPVTQYHVDPNYTPPVPSIVAHPFPVTQRKLLQDLNSGQYFMVDMPVQVKTKTFFDPETGKYVQLNVRQRSQSAVSQARTVEVLNHPYVVYPGFLPMSVPSLPSLRSSSQISAPAALSGEHKLPDSDSKRLRHQSNPRRSMPKCNEPVLGPCEKSGALHAGNNVNLPSRKTDIITMSELEDFAMES